MYGRVAGIGSTLPFTGLVLDLTWLVVAGVTLIAVGFAVVRLIPKKEA